MKNILTKLILILLLAGMTLSLASCNKNNDEYAAPSGFMTASAESADFYFYVPDDWTVDYTTAAAGAYFSASDPSSVSVMAWDLEYSDTTVDEWWELNQGEIEAVFQNFNLESEENTTINSLYAKKYTYTADLGDFSYKIMQAACVKNSTVYLFTYTSLPENYDAHIEEVNQMLDFLIIK
jgi:hypothetical protein